METEVALQHLQETATCPYPEQDRSSSRPQPISLISILILCSHLCLRLSSFLFPSGFLTKIL